MDGGHVQIIAVKRISWSLRWIAIIGKSVASNRSIRVQFARDRLDAMRRSDITIRMSIKSTVRHRKITSNSIKLVNSIISRDFFFTIIFFFLFYTLVSGELICEDVINILSSLYRSFLYFLFRFLDLIKCNI